MNEKVRIRIVNAYPGELYKNGDVLDAERAGGGWLIEIDGSPWFVWRWKAVEIPEPEPISDLNPHKAAYVATLIWSVRFQASGIGSTMEYWAGLNPREKDYARRLLAEIMAAPDEEGGK